MCYYINVAEQTTEDADVAQSVERILGKDEVTSSNLVISSTNLTRNREVFSYAYTNFHLLRPLFSYQLMNWKDCR